MSSSRLFDRIHADGAFERLSSMLADPSLTYHRIGSHFGLTRQRVSQLAQKVGIEGNRRRVERTRRRPPLGGDPQYPAYIRAVVAELQRVGLEVLPYSFYPPGQNVRLVRKKILVVNGIPCRTYWRSRGNRTRRGGREYVRFDVREETRQSKAVIFTVRNTASTKLYVIPTRDLRNVSSVWLPADGKYSPRKNNRPKRDWTAYEGAWHVLERLKETNQ